MLRFSYYRSDDGEQWDLCGRLAGLWVDEVRTVWRRIRRHTHAAHAVVDLRQVTFVDEAGEELLAEMQSAGANLIAAGVDHQHLLANLKRGGRGAVRRGWESGDR
jgi:hypothetical protein